MNSISTIVKTFSEASIELQTLAANETARPWYTSVEDFHTESSNSLREKYEEQEARRTELMSIMSGSADILAALELEIGTGRVMRLAAIEGIAPKAVMSLLNY